MSQKKGVVKLLEKKAHAMRNPLSVVQGFLDHIDTENLDPTGLQYHKAALKSVQCLIQLADEITNVEIAPLKIIEKHSKQVLGKEIMVSRDYLAQDVLIVDDDPEMQLQWRLILKKYHLNYIGISSGEDLLKQKLEFAKIKAAVVDFEYEGSSLNGFDVIEYLKRKKVRRIHLCTGLSRNPQIRQQAQKLGVSSIMDKPIPSDAGQILSEA